MNKKLTPFAVVGGLCSVLVLAAWFALAADPQLRIAREPNGSVTLEWNSQTGLVYQVYWNSNVLEDIGAWQQWTNFIAAGTVSTLTDTGGLGRSHPVLADSRFYALRYERGTNVTVISSDILTNMVWTVADSPFLITNDVRIRTGATLTIPSGVRVLFGAAGRLTVDGALQALGRPGQPVFFTSSKLFAIPGDWLGIRFNGTNAGGALSNAVVEYAVTGVTCTDASPNLTACTIRRCSQYGIFLDRCSPLIQNCVIERNGLDGIWCQNRSAPQILGNKVRGNTRDGISLNGVTGSDQNSLPGIRGNGLYDNVRYALLAQSYFQPAGVTIEARSNWWGTATPTDIPARIYDNFDAAASPWVDYGNWLVGEGGAPTPGRSVFATVTNSTVWRASESPIWVLGPLTIASNAAVSVEAGVTVKVLGNWRLDVLGSLAVGGTINNPVVFTSGRPVQSPGDWDRIQFSDSSVDTSCVLSNAVVEYATYGVVCISASPTLSGCWIRNCSQDGINLDQSSPLIQGGVIENNASEGIYCQNRSSPQILGNTIRNNGSDGVRLFGTSTTVDQNCRAVIQGNGIYGNRSGYEMQAYNYFQPAMVVIDARSNWWGTTLPATITARIWDYADRPSDSPYVDWGYWLGSAGGAPVLGRGAVGTITNNTIWRIGDSPVTVLGNLTVASNTLLSIEAGVEVQFVGNYRLDVNGTLQALGTSNNPVVFTSGDVFPLPGDWQGIRFNGTNAGGVLSNAVLEYAVTGVTCTDASPTLTGCWILGNSQYGIFLDRCSPLIQNCVIERNALDGIWCQNRSAPQILGNKVRGNARHGIVLNGSTTIDQNNLPVIRGNGIYDNVQYALVAQSYFQPTGVTIEARSNWWGTATPTDIPARIYDNFDAAASPWVDYGNWLVGEGGVPTPGRSVFATVTNSTVWRASESPIWVLGPLTIGSNTAVSVEAGVTVKVLGNWRLDVFGSLAVGGTTNNPVMFTSGQPVPARGNWLGVRFNDSSVDAACVWSNAVVEYALRGIECFDASPTFVGLVTRESSQYGIYLERSSPLIQGGAMENNTLDGIYCTWLSSPQILGNRIRFNGSDGIELAGFASSNRNSLPVISGNALEGNISYALNANTYFQAAGVVIDARSNWWGTASGPLIGARIFDFQDTAASPWVDWGSYLGAAGGLPVLGRGAVGTITNNTVWRISDSPVAVLGNLTVASNTLLSIEAGVEVQFVGNYRLDVNGTLQALGTSNNPVIFTSGDVFPLPGDWQGIRFNGTNAGGVLSNAVVEYAVTGVTCTDASPILTACWILGNSQYGIFLDRCSPLIQNCVIERNALDGIWCQNRSAPQILGNKVRGNARYGITLTGSISTDQNNLPVIRGNGIYDNVQYALVAQSYFQPTGVTIEARSNWWGTATPTDIPARIYDNFDAAASPWVDYGNWLVGEGGAPTPGRSVFATVTNSTVWRASESPIWVLGPLTIGSNTAVSVEAGVTVKVLGNWRLDVFGSLAVGGTTNNPVMFTSGQPVPARGNWLGVRFNDSSVDAACVWSNAVVEYALRGIECFDASPTFVGLVTRESSQYGIYLERSSPLIQGGAMENNTLDGIYCTWLSSPQILGNRIRFNGSDGIELAGFASSNRNNLPVISGNALEGNISYALNANTYFQPAGVVIDARSNWWGTASGPLIGARIFDFQDTAASPWVDWGSYLGAAGGLPVLGRGAVGTITNNTVWRISDSPVTVLGNLTVASNTLLSIEAGVEVQFVGNYRLDVNGTLQALGTSNNPVIFTSGDAFPLPGDWQGIRFLDSSSDELCILSNAVVEFAQTGVTCSDASPTLISSWILENSQHGVYLSRSSPRIQAVSIQYNLLDGIHCISNSSPAVIGNWIQGNASDGIELEGVVASDRNNLPVIQGNALDGNVQYALRATSYFRPTDVVIEARSNWWGAATTVGITTAIFDYLDTTASPWIDWGNWQVSSGGTTTAGRSALGNVTNSTVWRASESPIWILGPLTIASNTTVSVEAGVTVKVLGNWRVDVFGSLTVGGTTNNPVMFTSGQPVPARGNWLGVRFNDSSVDATCVWSNAVVEYALRGIECYDASPTFVGLVARESSQYGIYLERSSPLIAGGAMENNTLDGIYCTWLSSPQILGNRIRFNGSDGIELAGFASSNRNSLPVIQGNILERNTNFAVNANNYFQPSTVTINARSNWWGSAEGSLIPPKIFDILDSSASPWVDWGNWLGAETGPAAPGRYVFGTITNNTVWSASDQRIGVIGPVIVSTGAVLTIEAGVPVEFLITNRLDVAGGLQALGQWNNPVVFTSGRVAPTNGDWEGIRFLASSTNQPCLLSNAVVEYAIIGLNCVQSSPTFAGCHIRRNNTGVFLDTSAATIVSNLVEFNVTGVYCYDNSTSLLQGNTIVLNANNGVNVTPSTAASNRNPLPILLGNSFIFNSTAGSSWYNLFAGAFFQPATVTITAVSNWWSGTIDTNLVEGSVYHRRDNALSPTVDFRNPLGPNPNFSIMGNVNSLSWISPNGDGVQDLLSIQATLSHSAGWEVAILNSSNQTVANFSGQGTDVLCSWSGTNKMGNPVPEGRYRVVAFATNLQSSATAFSFGDYVRIDRTSPQNAANINPLPDGKIANLLTVLGTADDLSFAYYVLDLGAGANPAAFSVISSNRTPVVDGILGQFNTFAISNGLYTIRLRVFDYAGNVGITQIQIDVDNVHILNPDVGGVFFDPGVESAQIVFGLARSSDLTVRIRPVVVTSDAAGNFTVSLLPTAVRTMQLNGLAGQNAVPWDARNDAGQPVTNGTYVFSLVASAPYGRLDTYDPAYVAGPVTIINPTVSSNFNFVANEPIATSYSLVAPGFVGIGILPLLTLLPGLPRDQGSHVELFDGRNPITHQLVYGSFQINIKAQVLPENALVVDRQPLPIIASLQSESYVLLPTYSGVSEIRFSLAQAADVEIRVRDPNGNLLTLLQRVRRNAGSYALEWGGTTDANQVIGTEGDFEVLLSALEPVTGREEIRSANLSIRR